jgi:hypothetical protein
MNSYNAIFNTNFPQSPSNLVLPLDETEVPVKRGRGRPKGSKNKPKPGAPPPAPPPPKRKYPGIGLVREMRLKKNRAMFAEKIRQQEEEQKREAGEEYEYKEDEYEAPIDVALGQQVAAAVARQPVQDGGEYWSYQDGQSLLDVVGSSLGVEGSSGVGGIGADIMSGDQSDEMRGVFTLPDVPEVQQ